jgi:hypothetical protein
MRIACAISENCSMVMGAFASPASQQHMTAGFILVTMEDVVLASLLKFFLVTASLACLDLFQSMLMKIMFTAAVLCSSCPVPCSVAAGNVNGDHAGDIALLVEYLLKRKVQHENSNCLSRSRSIRYLG